MKFILYIIIFLITIISYIHILYHLKTSNIDEVYDIDYSNNVELHKICDLRQPFTFKIQEYSLYTNKNILSDLNKEINIQKEYDIDKKKKFLSYNNKKILENKYIYKDIVSLDQYIKPSFNVTSMYDIIITSDDISSDLVYNYNYRNFFHICEGNVTIRFIIPDNTKLLDHSTDYESLQELSYYDIWNNNKIKFIEINATENDTIYIPPYWWYSFKFNTPSLITSYKYRTFMNTVTILPQLIYSYVAITNKKQTFKVKNKKKKKKKNVTFDNKLKTSHT